MYRFFLAALYGAIMLALSIMSYHVIHLALDNARFVRESALTTARVTTIEVGHSSRYPQLRVAYTYQLPNEHEHRTGMDIGAPGFIGDVHAGDTIPIRYARTNPQRSHIAANTPHTLPDLALLLSAAVLISGTFSRAFRRRARAYR